MKDYTCIDVDTEENYKQKVNDKVKQKNWQSTIEFNEEPNISQTDKDIWFTLFFFLSCIFSTICW
jgi:hypothetical protein